MKARRGGTWAVWWDDVMVSRRELGKGGAEGRERKVESSPTCVMNKSRPRSPCCLAQHGPVCFHGSSSFQMAEFTHRE